MANRIACILVALFAASLITGCDKISGTGPKEVLNSFLDASLKNRSEEAYGYVSAEDKAVKSLGEYKAETNYDDNPFATVIVSNISYDVLEVTESGDTAKADVEITLPDMGVMFKDLMGAAFSPESRGKDKSEIEKEIVKKYENGNAPTVKKKSQFHLVKEDDGWKVALGWKSKQAAKEKGE